MNRWMIVVICLCAFTIIGATLAILIYRMKMKRILKNLSHMLDEAMNGTFREKEFDESLLSSVETKLAHYLASSEVSKQNLSEEKNKIKELISDISHQTKTPISNILLYSQLLNEQKLSEESKDYVYSLNEQAEKLNFLTGALVKISRLEAGIIEVQPASQLLQPMIEDVVKQIMPKMKAKQITLDVELINASAYFDRKWTEEAIYNIIDNAVKYTLENGKISIQIKKYELFTAILIRDNGIGIREEEQAKIFGRFYRSKDVSHREGVGIGLYLARQIISNQGGYIKVMSQKGKGATFSVFLQS